MVAGTTGCLGATFLALIAGCATARPPGRATETAAPAGRTVEIAVTKRGFEPADIPARIGETIELVFTRHVAHTCITSVVLWLTPDRTIERDLPLDVPVPLTLTLTEHGDIGFACPMHMFGGRIVVQ
jgi:plastocyanin domain-containing protein